MNFDVFDKSEIEAYKEEAKAKWGHTEAYRAYEAKAHGKQDHLITEFMSLFSAFGAMRHGNPADKEAQNQVAALQGYITEHFYPCTKEVLQGLGNLYVSDGRFQESIDNAGGEGTAEFVNQAISVYCASPSQA